VNQSHIQSDKLILLPYGEDPFESLAERLLHEHAADLPQLTDITLLLPSGTDTARLRRTLLNKAMERGHKALLGPHMMEWRTWLNRHPLPTYHSTSNYRRELILVEALRQHEKLFSGANLWALADSLLALFDELTLNRVELPEDLDGFTQQLAKAYGAHRHTLAAQAHEAQLVHTLWHAWHQELEARGIVDNNTRTLLQLAESLRQPPEHTLYLLAPDIHYHAEFAWLRGMLQTGKAVLLLHGHYHGKPSRHYHPEYPISRLLTALGEPNQRCGADNEYSRLLDTLYNADANQQPTLPERAAAFSAEVPLSPLVGRLAIYSAGSDEEEARAVELQVRRWLLEGCEHVGIVTENRRLARRVRALLERAGIYLDDTAGWALSTTSAAAVLEHWLQCIEEDFPHRAMLDLLKSPFFCAEKEREQHLEYVYRLEQDIILHENIGSGITRYRENLAYRQHRLPPELAEQLEPVAKLLEQLEQAAAPVTPYLTQASDAGTLLESLTSSLGQLGILPQLASDAAGMRLLEELQKMRQAVDEETMSMGWLEFRGWLGRTLERYTFRPPASGQVVTLMGLSQSPLAHFDALVLAGMEREFLPGTPTGTPFFNDAVRTELGLPAGEQQLAERFYHFRRLLEAAPRHLLTHRAQNGGEEVVASPWLELLQSFHHLAYHEPLADTQLEALLAQQESEVVQRRHPLPKRSRMPRPMLQRQLIPRRYSASTYQQLMDCPYQFFAARGLGLAPPEAIREALEKSDYGERVHRCLQAFHGGINGLPGPYTGNWEPRRRDDAIALLMQISQAVFARDLEDNFLHRGWLQRWQEKIPAYIDWQLERAENWRVVAVEEQREQSLRDYTLHGRLDRFDSDGEHLAIVDYKTGKTAKEHEVLSGEAVQLPFYALLTSSEASPVSRVEYLALDELPVASKSALEGEELDELRRAIGRRLESLQQQLLDGASLPAWGDDKTCGFCKMAGVCRKQAWDTH